MNTPSWSLLRQPQHYKPAHTHGDPKHFAERQEKRRLQAQAPTRRK